MNISIEKIIEKIDDYILVDVRSPLEYDLGSIRDAINIPVLDNEARQWVGTLYKKNKDEAYQVGLEHVLPKIPLIFDKLSQLKTENKTILIFCARGGKRSSSITEIMNLMNIKCFKLDGGYKSYREMVIKKLDEYVAKINLLVVTGNTGSGKTIVLNNLKEKTAVLDLEGFANHRGSVFGEIGLKIVTQKKFEDDLFFELKKIIDDSKKNVFIESESRKIGNVTLPKTLYEKMLLSPHILLDVSIRTRVNIICDIYKPEKINVDQVIEMITQNRFFKLNLGTNWVNEMVKILKEKDFELFIEKMLLDYYDKLYFKSQNNYNYSLKIKSDDLDEITEKLITYYNSLE